MLIWYREAHNPAEDNDAKRIARALRVRPPPLIRHVRMAAKASLTSTGSLAVLGTRADDPAFLLPLLQSPQASSTPWMKTFLLITLEELVRRFLAVRAVEPFFTRLWRARGDTPYSRVILEIFGCFFTFGSYIGLEHSRLGFIDGLWHVVRMG